MHHQSPNRSAESHQSGGQEHKLPVHKPDFQHSGPPCEVLEIGQTGNLRAALGSDVHIADKFYID